MAKSITDAPNTDLIPKTEKRSLRYDFSAVEIHDLSLNLAAKTKELAAVEEEKKSVSSQYTARLNEAKATCNKLSNQVTDGYEIRDIECEIGYHKPAQGMKTLTRRDNGKSFEEKMSDWEFNLFNQPDDIDYLEEDTEIKEPKKAKKK